jgi:hypothetical protein
MARRALTFGVRLRDRDRDQTLRIRAAREPGGGYVVEHRGPDGAARRRHHGDLAGAVRDGARTWRHRLH